MNTTAKLSSAKRARRAPGTRVNMDSEKLHATACRMIADEGFANVSFQKIADALGVSQSTIMHYFKNRSALALSVTQWVISQNVATVAALVKPSDSARTRLEKHFRGNLQWALDYPDQVSMILLLYYMGAVDQEFAALYRTVLGKARERIAGLITEAVAAGDAKLALPLAQATDILHEALLGGLLNGVATQELPRVSTELKKKWKAQFELLLGAGVS